MAKYQITHACGHVVEHQIFGSNSKGQRDNKREWLAGQVCTECYKAEQAAKHAESNAQSAAANKAANLPELSGSVKQVAWAESIRAEKVAALDAILNPELAAGEWAEMYAKCQGRRSINSPCLVLRYSA